MTYLGYNYKKSGKTNIKNRYGKSFQKTISA